MVAGQLSQVTISPCKVGDSLSFKLDFTTNEVKLYRNFQLEIAFKCDIPLTPNHYYPCVQLGNGVRVNIENVSEDLTSESSTVPFSFRDQMEVEQKEVLEDARGEKFYGTYRGRYWKLKIKSGDGVLELDISLQVLLWILLV
jgi:hypothetical protein